MNPDGSCSQGTFKCGSPDSKSKGICLPSNKYSSCPITDIRSELVPGYKAVTFTGFTLYLGTTTQANSVCDLNFGESHTCFIRGQYPITASREKYKLL